MDYLKSFIVGSSFPVFIFFFLSVMNLPHKNYSYEFYTIIAPLYLGTMNMLSLYLARYYKLNLRERYLLIGILSPLIVISAVFLTGAYPFNSVSKLHYMLRIIMIHFIIFNFVVYYIELYVC